jgi:hypothetical protein
MKASICCLCGKPATTDDPLTREHVPPKQFYPKHLRSGLNLWTVYTHKSCNNAYQADEDYFFHYSSLLVGKYSPEVAKSLFQDLKRRAIKGQTRKLLKDILRASREITNRCIVLPQGIERIEVDLSRLERVAIKIGRCLFFHDHSRFISYQSCKDIRLCEREDDVPEMYKISWDLSKINVNELTPEHPSRLIIISNTKGGAPASVTESVFDYRSAYIPDRGLHLYTLRFWSAFMFCMVFEEEDLSGITFARSD